ncbi:MAG: HAD-IC family P-type ATPase [Acidimicrobiales bacterium]
MSQQTQAPTLGLGAAEVDERVRTGLVNRVSGRSSRSVAEIVRANVVTRFNAILGTLLLVILVVGPLNDALFGIVLVSNTVIGVVQELRSKLALDRLALVHSPTATVWRSGVARALPVGDVVLDDVIDVGAGDQIVVDGELLVANRLEIDESLLTGESDAVVKARGHQVLSGSFVLAGEGRFRATKVGDQSYASRLAAEAKQFSLVHSELRSGIDSILRAITWLIGPTALILIVSQLASHSDVREALRGSVAGIGAMIPEGLVLLTSVAFAAGAMRVGRKGVLVQELAAIEGLARVDVICVDKTGTITEPELVVAYVTPLDDTVAVHDVLAALARVERSPNASLRAIATANSSPPGWTPTQVAPFSSERRWSGAVFGQRRGWVLGAPDALLVAGDEVRADAEAMAATGLRTLLLAGARAPLPDDGAPLDIAPVAIVCLEERIRPEASSTVAYFQSQGVTLKVISGDHPRTVAAVAARAGIDVGDGPIDGNDLPRDIDALSDVVERTTVFGRVGPHQKKAMVEALQRRGHVVAMTGDGVNDVLALKQADLGVAMGSGSAAARSVARLVLVDGSFAALPPVVAEGRRVLANVERVANLFVTKTVYAMALSISIALAGLEFPFLPRQLTVISTLTIGVPAFFLALAPGSARARPGFAARVLRFAIPAGSIAAAATFTGYALARTEHSSHLADARTAATITLFGVSFWVLAILARPLNTLRKLLLTAMVAGFALALAVPFLRRFYALDLPTPLVFFGCLGVIAIADVLLEVGWRGVESLRARRERQAAEIDQVS